jgi:hypothetical protein
MLQQRSVTQAKDFVTSEPTVDVIGSNAESELDSSASCGLAESARPDVNAAKRFMAARP